MNKYTGTQFQPKIRPLIGLVRLLSFFLHFTAIWNIYWLKKFRRLFLNANILICFVFFWTDSSNYIALLGLVLDVLSAKPSVIIHEHDENSWQRLFTVLSHNKKKLKSHQLLSLLYYLLQSDLEKIKLHAVFFQVVLYNYYIVLLLLNMVC